MKRLTVHEKQFYANDQKVPIGWIYCMRIKLPRARLKIFEKKIKTITTHLKLKKKENKLYISILGQFQPDSAFFSASTCIFLTVNLTVFFYRRKILRMWDFTRRFLFSNCCDLLSFFWETHDQNGINGDASTRHIYMLWKF